MDQHQQMVIWLNVLHRIAILVRIDVLYTKNPPGARNTRGFDQPKWAADERSIAQAA